MKLLFEEYGEVIITIIGGFMILAIIIGACLQTKIDVMHSEDINKINPLLETIGEFECKDVLVNSLDDDLLQNVIAKSNMGRDLKNNITVRLNNTDGQYYVEYILKFNNDFMIKKAKCYIKEEEEDENNV